jgi:hypothetical protein
VRFLNVAKEEEGADGAAAAEERVDDAGLLALAAAVREHVSLEGMWMEDVPLDTPVVLDAFIDVSLARCLKYIEFERCSLLPASVPALARLLSGGTLQRLVVFGGRAQLLDAPAAALLAGALRTNTTLRFLRLAVVGLWHDAQAGAGLVAALTAHPSLRCLWLDNNWPMTAGDAAAAGAALGALVAANAPALRKLYLAWCSLGDAGLAPVLDALPANTHLRVLHCSDNDISAAFVRDAFLPAIRANGSLRELVASEWWGGVADGVAPEEVLQAEALVKARADADAAAAGAAA